jgi:hypothetical protein
MLVNSGDVKFSSKSLPKNFRDQKAPVCYCTVQ